MIYGMAINTYIDHSIKVPKKRGSFYPPPTPHYCKQVIVPFRKFSLVLNQVVPTLVQIG